jgi:sRNA-binding regulator protein Hfq
MTPQMGQRVKVLFRNGTLVEGTVEDWLDNYVQLKSITDESVIIISHPAEDIMLVKIFPLQTEEKEEEPVSEPPSENEAEAEFRAFYDQPRRSAYDLSANRTLAELHAMRAEEERQIISRKLKSHYPSQVKRPAYGYPRFFAKPRSK